MGLVKDAYIYLVVIFALALALALAGFWRALFFAPAFALFLVACFIAYFFRDPRRVVPDDSALVVSPADGRVTRIERLDPNSADSPTVVSVFLSPFDVHINRAPIAGEIVDVSYTKGRFMIATRDEASVVNEQNALTIRGEEMTVVVKQIAGVLARRIVCWKRAGDRVEMGERIGLIKFGSRTDLVLPRRVEIMVKVGERVRGGESVIGRIL